jgi:tryptophan-rich sensory protein
MIEYAKMIFFLERLGRNDNFEKWLIFYGILFGLSSYLTYTKKQNQSHTHTHNAISLITILTYKVLFRLWQPIYNVIH